MWPFNKKNENLRCRYCGSSKNKDGKPFRNWHALGGHATQCKKRPKARK